MSTEILYPFQLTPSGSIASTTVPAIQAQQHVTSLVSTRPGERVMQPTYGVALADNLFAASSEVAASVIENEVTTALAEWEPSIDVISVGQVNADEANEGVLTVDVDYTTGSVTTLSSVNTATVLVGGQVDQTVRDNG